MPANFKIVTAAQMSALEQAAEQQGVPTDALMETAGLAVAQYARQRLNGVADARCNHPHRPRQQRRRRPRRRPTPPSLGR